MKSERDAFDKAMTMLSHIDNSRLDRYYSNPIYVDKFNGKVYIIPKRNRTVRKMEGHHEGICAEHHELFAGILQKGELRAGFSADKRTFGWEIAQRREDRIDCAQFTIGLWHNLFYLNV